MATVMHEWVEEILKFFEYEHLPPVAREVSREYHRLAHLEAAAYMEHHGSWSEHITGLRKLLEAKDCAVRGARRRTR